VNYDVVSKIIEDPRVATLKFVGSTEVGKKLAEQCGRAMKRCAFELGGSDPFIVFDDAEIDLAVSKALQGRLHTTGQACNNAKRFIIHENIYNEFMSKLKSQLDSYIKVGDPMDPETTIGPLSMQKSKEDLTKQVKESIEKGATVSYGSLDWKMEDPNLKDGAYFYPMILENVQPGM